MMNCRRKKFTMQMLPVVMMFAVLLSCQSQQETISIPDLKNVKKMIVYLIRNMIPEPELLQ